MTVPIRVRPGSQHPDLVLRAVAELAQRWAGRPEIILLTRSELSPFAPSYETSGFWVAGALWSWARSQTWYREPGCHGELIASLPWVVEVGGGDCDDLACSQATMASTLGIPCAVGRIWTGPSSAHVTTVVGDHWRGGPVEWFSVDPENTEPLHIDPQVLPGLWVAV